MWMELLKDYNCTILYQPKKVDVVADAPSKKSMDSLALVVVVRRPLIKGFHDLEGLGFRFEVSSSRVLLAQVKAQSS